MSASIATDVARHARLVDDAERDVVEVRHRPSGWHRSSSRSEATGGCRDPRNRRSESGVPEGFDVKIRPWRLNAVDVLVAERVRLVVTSKPARADVAPHVVPLPVPGRVGHRPASTAHRIARGVDSVEVGRVDVVEQVVVVRPRAVAVVTPMAFGLVVVVRSIVGEMMP